MKGEGALERANFSAPASPVSPVPRQAGGKAAPDAYPLEPLVVERKDEVYTMAADGTGNVLHTVVARVQGESTLKELKILSLGFASKSEHVEWVYARVRHADGTTRETPVDGAIEVAEAVTQAAPFYSDLKQSQLPLKDLRVGDRIEWQARLVRTVAEAPGEFWGQSSFFQDGILLDQVVELRVPKGLSVNVWSHGAKPVESDQGSEHVYRWTSSSRKVTVGPEADAGREADKKRIRTAEEEQDTREGKLPDVAWTTFKSWAEVGAWYRKLEADRFTPTPEIRAKVAQLTAGKGTEQEKVEAVYAYVATQIHYIGVAFGIGRYQPHSADDVFGNQYGDCKDKHTLLAAMLTALGEHPDAVLIGAGIRFNPAVPSPAAFNHLITRVQVAGQPVWLDTTAEVAPFGMLVYPTRDHEALVIPESGEAHLERTPASKPIAESQQLQANGVLTDQGVSTSKFVLTVRGDTEIILRSAFRQYSPAQYDQVVQGLVTALSFGGTVSHAQLSPLEDTTGPLTITFDYKRDKGGDWDHLRILAQITPNSLPIPDPKDAPVQSLELGQPRVELSDAVMALPEGWGAELPEAVHKKSPYLTLDITYRMDKGTLYTEKRIEVLQPRVPVSDWRTYYRFTQEAGLGEETYIQLRFVSGAHKVHHVVKADVVPEFELLEPANSSADQEKDAAKLVHQAFSALQQHHIQEAEPLLADAKVRNNTEPGLWSEYGWLDFQKGEISAAIDEYQKELKLHPASTSVYSPLVVSLLLKNRRDDAKAALQQWSAAAPSDPRPVLRLASMQVDDGDSQGAINRLQAALKEESGIDPLGKEQLRFALGQTEWKTGGKAQAHETLVSLLKSTEDLSLMNSAAYELADKGLELPLDESAIMKALSSMEAESQTWTLDEPEETLRQKSRTLEASWDTLGWIQFREGKLADAERSITAAWQCRQTLAVARHLGEIAEAQKKKQEALRDYELAFATTPTYDVMGVKKAPTPDQKELTARIEALHEAGAKSSDEDGAAGLKKLGTVPLGAADGLEGKAEYKLLLNAEKVLRVEARSGQSLPGGAERIAQSRFAGFFPPDSKARLLLVGLLNCHAGVCEFVLEP